VNQRWLGGTLTNLATIRKSIGRLKYIEDIENSPDFKKMGKQELAALGREAAKLKRNLDGILEMQKLPDAMVVIDTTREQNAVLEAKAPWYPTVAIVDTNADPGADRLPDRRQRRRDPRDPRGVAEAGRLHRLRHWGSPRARAGRDGWRLGVIFFGEHLVSLAQPLPRQAKRLSSNYYG
jgi:hypothetical protein